MAADKRHLVIFSGGGWHYRGHRGFLMDEWLLALTGKLQPKVCLLATAQGDSSEQLSLFFKAMNGRAQLSWAPMFSLLPSGQDAQQNLLDADLIYVPGGYAQATVGSWRAAGWDIAIREAWEDGTVIAAMCAGGMALSHMYANRWFDKPGLGEGLGFLDISLTVHAQHKLYEPVGSLFRHAIRDGLLTPGYQLQDGCCLRFQGTDLAECVTTQPSDAAGWYIEPAGEPEAQIVEHQLYSESLEARLRLDVDEDTDEFDQLVREMPVRQRRERLRTALNAARGPLDGPEVITASIESPLDADTDTETGEFPEQARFVIEDPAAANSAP